VPQKSGGIASRACLAPDIELLRKPQRGRAHFTLGATATAAVEQAALGRSSQHRPSAALPSPTSRLKYTRLLQALDFCASLDYTMCT
jgi:hypothetical protein